MEIPEVLPTQQEELLQESYVEKKIIQYVNQYGNLEAVEDGQYEMRMQEQMEFTEAIRRPLVAEQSHPSLTEQSIHNGGEQESIASNAAGTQAARIEGEE